MFCSINPQPVGQEHEITPTGVRVDKDVSLMKMHFDLHTKYEDMSPIMIPSGYTRDYIDGTHCRMYKYIYVLASLYSSVVCRLCHIEALLHLQV